LFIPPRHAVHPVDAVVTRDHSYGYVGIGIGTIAVMGIGAVVIMGIGVVAVIGIDTVAVIGIGAIIIIGWARLPL